MKIIPTPKSCIASVENMSLIGFSSIEVNVKKDVTLTRALEFIEEKFKSPSGQPLILSNSGDEFFAERNAKEQGYILIRDSDAVKLYAQSSVGFLYGVMTLLQLYGDAPREFKIYDRPAIRFRGNMNTLWAESGVWSYDFGDGLDNALKRLYSAIDDMAKAKLNLMYADAFGFALDRFPGYNEAMKALSDYAKVFGVRIMVGGYGMGYGQSASHHFMGRIFRNRRPYPDGKLYDCIGTCFRNREVMPIEELHGRSFGTCLTNNELTDDKISEIRDYIKATGASVLYMHNMDADEIHEPLWLARCDKCRVLFPSDSLYDKDGAAGAFAAFYDRILDALLPEFPNLVICPISPGYAYHTWTTDYCFEKCRKFWSSVMKYLKHKNGIVPSFRELFIQKNDERMRFDMLDEVLDVYGCAYFSGGDGFYSDKIYTPSAPYVALMKNSELIICANGGALQKPTQYANAEYLWNPTDSAFYNIKTAKNYDELTEHYNSLRFGKIRPDEIYGENGLLETSCNLLYGERFAKDIADVYSLRGKGNVCPVFTPASVEIYTNINKVNLPMSWDEPISPEDQERMKERFSESARVTDAANEILEKVLSADKGELKNKEEIEFIYKTTKMTGKLCHLLARYMELYIKADAYFSRGDSILGVIDGCEKLKNEADEILISFENDSYKPFDVFGGIYTRREELFDFVSYSAGQIIKSIESNTRIPEEKRPKKNSLWW